MAEKKQDAKEEKKQESVGTTDSSSATEKNNKEQNKENKIKEKEKHKDKSHSSPKEKKEKKPKEKKSSSLPTSTIPGLNIGSKILNQAKINQNKQNNNPLLNAASGIVRPKGSLLEEEEEFVNEPKNYPSFNIGNKKKDNNKEESETREEKPQNLESDPKENGKKKLDISGELEISAILKKSLPFILPAFGVILFVILITSIAITSMGQFTPLLGINSETGEDIGDEEYEADTKEEKELYERVKKVKEEFEKEHDITIDAQLIVSTIVIIQNYNESLTFDDFGESDIKEIVEAMFKDPENPEYDKDTFEHNLEETILPKYIEGRDDYKEIVKEIFEYTDSYEELVKSDKPQKEEEISSEGNNMYWWPVGSKKTTKANGKTFASDTPTSTQITSYFAGRKDPFTGQISTHNGMDLVGLNPSYGAENVIAALDGTVIYPNSIGGSCPSGADMGCGGGYGNHIIIQHADGNFTLYAHLHQGMVFVKAGDTVKQGQVIAKMGSSGRSTGTHLHFEVREGVNSHAGVVDPLKYIDPKNPRPTSSGSSWSLYETTLSKAEFVAKMKSYCKRSKNTAFCTNFANHAETVYDVSKSAHVNPELVVVTAGAEQGWQKTCGYNFYGIGISNGAGCSAGAQYSSLEAGIRGYAKVMDSYGPGKEQAAQIESRYKERKAANCDPAGHGKPGTLQGMQSVYSWIGTYRYNPGSWGDGGCVYLKLIYPNYPYCKPSTAAVDNQTKTTVCEQNDYTAYQLKGKYKLRKEIFGL